MDKKEIKQIVKRALSENKDLTKFLMDHKAYGRYVKNCVKHLEDKNNISCVSEICNRNIVENTSPICGMFTYVYTAEDHKYWSSLNCEYLTSSPTAAKKIVVFK